MAPMGTWFRYYQILGCYLRSFVPYSISDIIINLGISDIPSWNQVQFKSASRAFWRCLILESSPHIKFPTVLPLDSRTMTSGLSLAANSTTSTAANYRRVKSKCEINGTRHTHRFVLWTSRWLTIAFFKRQVFSGVLDTLASRGLRPWVIEYTILYVDISTTWIGFLASSFKKHIEMISYCIYIWYVSFPKTIWTKMAILGPTFSASVPDKKNNCFWSICLKGVTTGCQVGGFNPSEKY